jgi:hypothetical protein
LSAAQIQTRTFIARFPDLAQAAGTDRHLAADCQLFMGSDQSDPRQANRVKYM